LFDVRKKGSPCSQAPPAASVTQSATRQPQAASASTKTETNEDEDRAASEITAKSIKPKARVIEYPTDAENSKVKGLELNDMI
jgi:hypothetical protein